MSNSATRRRIRAQASPRDPETMRFILDAPVQDGRSASFNAATDDAPLARALFATEDVRRVQVMGETIMVTRAPGSDWQTLKPTVAAAIRRVLESSDQPLGAPPAQSSAEGRDATLLAAVTEVLDTRANPSIAGHGGHIRAEDARDGAVYLRMSGGCQGCAASSVTLRNGVETILRAALPAIREIVDVTDHAGGQNPFYRDVPGQSPVFARPVPRGVIGWDGGQVTIDPNYLAPRLGLKPDALRAGLACSDIVITTEGRPAPSHEEGMRVIVRSAERTWAAEVMADGTARELPPPRAAAAPGGRTPATLAQSVRRHLHTLPADKLPITYSALAWGLGLYAPGSIRKITRALETTMREDAEAGRPFIAARVVGRGLGQV
ncbi:NifU family protein, partial [Aurantimonas sp. C2-3-R2]|nr:NifU family protein [Aurantimonas sp. C2-3-R2]